ncbi:MAG: glycosyltransferase family 4 protein [Candidatus Hodarchaeota archaeon]
MGQIKIAILSYAYKGINPHGSSVYVQNLLKILSRFKSIIIDFYCPYPNFEFKKIKNINYIYIPIIKVPLLRYLSYSYRTAKRVNKKKYDIIHSNNGAGLFLSNLDFETFHHNEPFSPKSIFRWLNYQSLRINLHKTRQIIAVSEQARKELIKIEKINEKKIIIINNSIDCEKYNTQINNSELEHKFKESNDEKILLYVGLLVPRKRPTLAIDTLDYILTRNYSACLIIIGTGPMYNFLIRYTKKRNLEHEVSFLGNVLDVAPFYKMADILLVPSEHEGFGFPYLEGPACGTKFIGFDTGIATIAANADLGIIAQNTNDFKKKALDYIINNQKLNKSHFEFILRNFSLKHFEKRILKIYFNYFNLKR